MKVPKNKTICSHGETIGECIFLNDEPSIIDGCGQLRRVSTFRCRCGNIFSALFNNVKSIKTISCGCVGIARSREKCMTHGATANCRASGYYVWLAIRRRCREEKCKSFPEYGGVGVTICDEWYDSFSSFISYVGTRPSILHTIDRFPDNDGNYEPGNVRWATPTQQNNNKSNNVFIEYNNQTKTLAEWCTEYDINYKSAHKRYHVKKWHVDDIIKRGIDNKKGILYKSFPRKKATI